MSGVVVVGKTKGVVLDSQRTAIVAMSRYSCVYTRSVSGRREDPSMRSAHTG